MLKITSFGYLVVESKQFESSTLLFIYILYFIGYFLSFIKEAIIAIILCIDNFMLLVTACFTLLLLQLFFFLFIRKRRIESNRRRKGFGFQTNFTTKVIMSIRPLIKNIYIYFSLSCYLHGDNFIEFENIYRSL